MFNADKQIPLVINTVENCFRNICIVGSNQSACDLFRYLSFNNEIVVSHIQDVSIEDTIYVNTGRDC